MAGICIDRIQFKVILKHMGCHKTRVEFKNEVQH